MVGLSAQIVSVQLMLPECCQMACMPRAVVELVLHWWQTLRVPTSITEQEEVQVEVTRLLVECYFDIVRANLQVRLFSCMFS